MNTLEEEKKIESQRKIASIKAKVLTIARFNRMLKNAKENQELLGALLVLVLVAGPVIIALQFAHATASEVLDTVREHKNSAKSGSGKELPPEETDALNKF